MLIPNKHNGYQAGIRIYCLGGGGGGGGGPTEPAAPPPPPPRMPSAAPAPQFQTYGQGDRTGSLVQAGAGMRPSQLDYSRPMYDPNYQDNIVGYEQSSQFYQPIYQPQYQNYNMGNPMGVSQYGQGFGGFNPYTMPMQTPFMQQPMAQSVQTPFSSGMSQPRQPIVTRSAQVRGTPNVMMRRAEGGIASLVDDE